MQHSVLPKLRDARARLVDPVWMCHQRNRIRLVPQICLDRLVRRKASTDLETSTGRGGLGNVGNQVLLGATFGNHSTTLDKRVAMVTVVPLGGIYSHCVATVQSRY